MQWFVNVIGQALKSADVRDLLSAVGKGLASDTGKKILAGVLTAAAVGVVCYAVYEEITLNQIKEKARNKCPEGLKAMILEKEKDAVIVGIFDDNDQQIDTMKMQSEKGVADEVKTGEVILLSA